MSKLSSLLNVVLVFLLLAALGYVFTHRTEVAKQLAQVQATIFPPCDKPIPYKIGTIDQRFNITSTDVAKHLEEAAQLWNTAAGKTVLVYAPNDPKAMPVNFVYDARQQTVTLGEKIDKTEASQDQERAQIEALQQQYLTAQQSYASAVASFNRESEAYGAEVDRVNAQGGADPATYARLNKEKADLKEKQRALESQGSSLTLQGNQLKQKIDSYNARVRDINQVVNTFNNTVGGDFEEGQYVRTSTGAQRIDIYAYKGQDELLHSLAHEFGHSLGLDHNQTPASIMFPYNRSSVTLSAQDLADLKVACRL